MLTLTEDIFEEEKLFQIIPCEHLRQVIRVVGKQAPSYASPKLWITHSRTGVRCRATTVAKNLSCHDMDKDQTSFGWNFGTFLWEYFLWIDHWYQTIFWNWGNNFDGNKHVGQFWPDIIAYLAMFSRSIWQCILTPKKFNAAFSVNSRMVESRHSCP